MAVPPFNKPIRRSSDDLSAVKAIEDREAQLRAAKQLLDESSQEADALRIRAAELQRLLDATIEASKRPTPRVEMERSIPPKGAVTAHVLGKRVVIPLALLAPVATVVWAVVQNYNALMQQLKDLNAAVAGDVKIHEALDKRISTLEADNTSLRVVVAKQAGFLEGALPIAGVKAKAESGAISVDVESDPQAPGVKPRRMVNVTTPIPAPAPKSK